MTQPRTSDTSACRPGATHTPRRRGSAVARAAGFTFLATLLAACGGGGELDGEWIGVDESERDDGTCILDYQMRSSSADPWRTSNADAGCQVTISGTEVELRVGNAGRGVYDCQGTLAGSGTQLAGPVQCTLNEEMMAGGSPSCVRPTGPAEVTLNRTGDELVARVTVPHAGEGSTPCREYGPQASFHGRWIQR